MVDLLKLKLRVFIVILFVFILLQLKLIFFWCNQLGFQGFSFGIILLIGLLVTVGGYIMHQLFGWIAGIVVFSLELLHFYFILIIGFSNLSTASLIVSLVMNLSGILLTTFIYGVFILYVISTKNYFNQIPSEESMFHKVMFVFLLLAFIGSLFVVYQNSKATVCPEPYTFNDEERFATPENALTTIMEAYYNQDVKTYTQMMYYSDSFKQKVEQTGTDFPTRLEIQGKMIKKNRMYDKVDRIEITKKEERNENEVYIEYTAYFKKIKDAAVSAPKQGAENLIRINGEWKITPEPALDEDLKRVGVA